MGGKFDLSTLKIHTIIILCLLIIYNCKNTAIKVIKK